MRTRSWQGRARGAGAVILLVVAGLPGSVSAQDARGAGTRFERELQQLVDALLAKRVASRRAQAEARELQLAVQGGALADGERARAASALQRVRTQLAALEAEGGRIQRQLDQVCAADRRPEGWVGIYYSASVSAVRDDDGRLLMRFEDAPAIESVEPGSPAERAGIRGGDRLLSLGGHALPVAELDMRPLLVPGTRMAVRVRRGVEVKQFTVTVEPRPADFATPCPWIDERIAAAFSWAGLEPEPSPGVAGAGGPAAGRAPTAVGLGRGRRAASVLPPLPPVAPANGATTVTFAGAELVAVGPQLARTLGVARGVLVLRVERGTPAAGAGLREGDVIVAMEGASLTSPLTFLEAVEQPTRRALRLQVLRRRVPMDVTLAW